MTSSPGFTMAMIAKVKMGFPPGVTTTWSGVTASFRSLAMKAAMASRTSGRPAEGP